MKITIQVRIETEDYTLTQDLIYLERKTLSAETLGLSLEEAKCLTAALQEKLIIQQIKEYTTQQRPCPCCGKNRPLKGYHPLVYRTLFGKFRIQSPRLWECSCQGQTKTSFSPLSKILPERAAPELTYLQAKWASLMSYGMTVKVLPLKTNSFSVACTALKVSTRLEQELGPEQGMFVDGCPRIWDALPRPDAPLTVALDGGYVHAREGANRKAGWFEVIVGKILQEQQTSKRFGFVASYDAKPKRRLYELLQQQGLQMNQALTFLTDGGDTVRDLPLYLSPISEHILDWFHITMRLTVMKQMAKTMKFPHDFKPIEELDRVKWFLWHGNVFKALDGLDDLSVDVEAFSKNKDSKKENLAKALQEFYSYIKFNAPSIPNYGERYRQGEAISSSFAESTVNELISKRMGKNQQMRWTKKGAHLLLQLRVKTLNDELKPTFCRWYPNMNPDLESAFPLAA